MKSRFSVALGFLALIVVGALLLAMPFARASGTWGGWRVSLFTACSAVCVTGLSVVDVAREFSFAGQLVLIALVEIGCVGLITVGTFLIVAIGRRISLSSEFTLMNAYGVAAVRGLKGLVVWVVCSMLLIEGIGAVLLWWRTGEAYTSIFYSVMSFCNAGFSIRPGSLAAFADDAPSVLVMALETILGGLGFLAIFNLCTFKFLRRSSGGRGRLSLHTKVVLRFTVYLLLLSFVAFLVLEWNGVLANLPFGRKLLVGFYQAVTPRTCGFSLVPTESLKPLTRLVYENLMFIGGAPGSAAAGIKVTTFAVLLYTLRAMCRGATETVIYRRIVPTEIVRESLVIFMALIALTALVFGALLATDGARLGIEALFFEAVSAITTTGLSMGTTTASLSAGGQAVVMFAMFIGRLGALTVVMMIGDRESPSHVRYASEELVVG